MSDAAVSADASICRNCGARAPDKFCPSCGQETDTRLPTLRQFMREATGRLVSFDSRFWRTLFALVAKPGFLTREYLDGRRRRYLRPARLYLVISVVLFAIVRFDAPLLVGDKPLVILDESDKAALPPAKSPTSMDAAEEGFNITLDKEANIVVEGGGRNALPRALRARIDRFNHLDRLEKFDQIVGGMTRYGPYALFVLLPANAWLQQIAYAGRSRRYPRRPRKYVEHLVYATHIHTFIFLVIGVSMLTPDWIGAAVWLWALYYLFRAKRVIYGGSIWGGALRGLLVSISYGLMIVVATVALIVAAILVR